MLLNAITARIPAAVYCGLAGAKFVAREAAIRQPPDRFLHVYFGTEKAFLENVLVPASMLDQKAVDRLERLGIRTLGDLRRLPPGELERQAKPYAARLRRLAIGIDSEAVRALWPQRMIEQKFDFDEEIVDSNRIEQALLRCSARISRMLGRDYGRTLRLVMHRTDRLKCCASERISAPINAAGDLYLVSLRLLKRLALTSAVTGLRLSIRDINIGSGMQLRLLDDNQAMGGLPNERQSALETTSGFLHARYGELAMTRAATFIKPEQIGLTLASLGRRLCVPVEVNCENGIPVSFLHHRCNYRITCVLDRWKLTECRGDTVCERNSFRVSYGRCAIADLEQSAAGWRLVGVGD